MVSCGYLSHLVLNLSGCWNSAIASTFPRDPVAVIIRGQRAGAVGEIGDGTPRKLQKRPATGWKQEQGDTSRWRNAGRRISRKQQLGFARVTNKPLVSMPHFGSFHGNKDSAKDRVRKTLA
ncbi:hypothetical protein SELMODRAFT_413995 [Selaginella moellendorffii]|uniref:Uncharacterized protein n=1 Tax=Selaginella moellendorffii TaxID=88036 RepID=D8RRA6_SELML|nr:hypothetical protein SELMODRAFT_413995 [Selaginella moellendorffii]